MPWARLSKREGIFVALAKPRPALRNQPASSSGSKRGICKRTPTPRSLTLSNFSIDKTFAARAVAVAGATRALGTQDHLRYARHLPSPLTLTKRRSAWLERRLAIAGKNRGLARPWRVCRLSRCLDLTSCPKAGAMLPHRALKLGKAILSQRIHVARAQREIGHHSKVPGTPARAEDVRQGQYGSSARAIGYGYETRETQDQTWPLNSDHQKQAKNPGTDQKLGPV